MDTIWTSEFAAAGWLKPFTGVQRQEALNNVLPIAAQGAQYKGKLYVVPLNTNAGTFTYTVPSFSVVTFAGTLQKLTMCHNGHTISIDQNAVPAHLAIGDTVGNCL